MAKTLHSQCRWLGTDPWSENQISHVTAKSLNAKVKRSHVLQLIPGNSPGEKKKKVKGGSRCDDRSKKVD